MITRKKWAAIVRKRKALARAKPVVQQPSLTVRALIEARRASNTSGTWIPTYAHRSSEDQINRPECAPNMDSTAVIERPVYDGARKLLGIATMHKSNLVPIFSEEEAVSVATMRRN